MSKFECKPYSIFCNYNELIPECRNSGIKWFIGLFIGTILGVFLSIALFFIAKNTIQWFYYKLIKKRDRKQIAQIEKLEKQLGRKTPRTEGFRTINEKLIKAFEITKAKKENFSD